MMAHSAPTPVAPPAETATHFSTDRPQPQPDHGTHPTAHPTANPGYFENLGASVTPLPKRFHIGTPLAAALGPLRQSERKGCAAQMEPG